MSDWWKDKTAQELRDIEQDWAKKYALRFVPIEPERYLNELESALSRYSARQKEDVKKAFSETKMMAKRHTKQLRGPDGRFAKAGSYEAKAAIGDFIPLWAWGLGVVFASLGWAALIISIVYFFSRQ